MRPATLAKLAVAGSRTDVLRTVLSAFSAGLAVLSLLAAAAVGAIHGDPDRYTSALLNEHGLRPGVMTAMVLLALPVLALAGQSVRLGAPARDRRLAAIRLAGATPGQAVLIATAETAAASLLGGVVGLIAYEILRKLLTQRDHLGRLRLPADVRPPILVVIAVLLVVPVLAGLISGILMRRVIVTPLGVVRRVRERGPKPWPGVLIVAGIGLFAGLRAVGDSGADVPSRLVTLWLAASILLTVLGVVLGVGWISYTSGRLLGRYGRRPSTLLAGRRLMSDPWQGSRNLAALLSMVIVGSIALGYREIFVTTARALTLVREPGDEWNSGFYIGAVRLVMVAVGLGLIVATGGVLVALAENIVARRRTYAALTAAGVPRSTLSLAVLWQSVVPLVPALVLALGSGIELTRLITDRVTVVGGDTGACAATAADGSCQAVAQTSTLTMTLGVPVPYGLLFLLGGFALVVMLLAVGAGLFVLRSSTDLEELRVG